MNLKELEEKLRVLDSDPNGVLLWQDEWDLVQELRAARQAIQFYLNETRAAAAWTRVPMFRPGLQKVLDRVRDE